MVDNVGTQCRKSILIKIIQQIKMKKLFPILGVVALVLGMVAFIAPMAKAADPAGSMTSTALTVDLGQLKAINEIVITDAGGEITDATDIKIRIPEGVNAIWDTADTTIVADVTGATGVVSTTVTYESAKIVVLDVTTSFTDGDFVTISGLSMIGQTATSVATALDWSVDGATYLAGDATTQVTVADGAEDTLTDVDLSPVDPITGATTTYTIIFTIPATGVLPADGKIVVDFPAGFDTTGVTTATSGAMDGGFTIADIDGTGFTVTRDGTGTNELAGATSIVVPNIINGAAAAHTVNVAITTAGDAALANANDVDDVTILAAPAAIDDLTCQASGQAGAVWLRWTVPAGASISYTAKHALAAITNDGEFNAGTTITQSWSIGTVGTAAQQLVTGLNPNTQYYFSMKSTGFGPTTSAISAPTSTNCVAPASAPAALDTTAPNTQITTPAGGSTVQAGQALKITGTAIDAGGSSVQKIEVSLDGGSTWNNATVTDDDGTNVIWEYTWANAQAGTVVIQARATDWTNNIETSPAEITVTVSSTVSAPTTPTTPTTPATPTTTEQLQTQLQTLRVQLLNLLVQLVVQLQAQLAAIQ